MKRMSMKFAVSRNEWETLLRLAKRATPQDAAEHEVQKVLRDYITLALATEIEIIHPRRSSKPA